MNEYEARRKQNIVQRLFAADNKETKIYKYSLQ